MNNINNQEYQDFLKNNPGRGILSIRVYTASEAIPIENLKVVVSKEINNSDVIFFEGYSDSSGVVNDIILPTSKLDSNDLEIPQGTTYNIKAMIANMSEEFKVEMFEGVTVVQKINVVLTNMEGF